MTDTTKPSAQRTDTTWTRDNTIRYVPTCQLTGEIRVRIYPLAPSPTPVRTDVWIKDWSCWP
jgi:hypothetical protein